MIGKSRAETRRLAHAGQAGRTTACAGGRTCAATSSVTTNGDHYDGAGPALTVRRRLGQRRLRVRRVSRGYGQQRLDCGRRCGDFDQDDVTLGGFVGWYAGNVWVNGQFSWTSVSYDVDRNVQLGPAVRSYDGSPDGEQPQRRRQRRLGLRRRRAHATARWSRRAGAAHRRRRLRRKPQPTLSTSLAYPDQNFDSLIGSRRLAGAATRSTTTASRTRA